MAVIIVISLTSAYFFLFRSQLSQISSLNTQLNALETSFTKIKKDESYVPKLEKDIIDNKQKISMIKKRMPTDISMAELVQSLSQIGTKLGIKEYNSLVPGNIITLDKYVMIPLKLIFYCEYPKLIEYLKELEKMERLTRIDSLNIKTNDLDPEEIIVDLPLTAFSLLEQTKK